MKIRPVPRLDNLALHAFGIEMSPKALSIPRFGASGKFLVEKKKQNLFFFL